MWKLTASDLWSGFPWPTADPKESIIICFVELRIYHLHFCKVSFGFIEVFGGRFAISISTQLSSFHSQDQQYPETAPECEILSFSEESEHTAAWPVTSEAPGHKQPAKIAFWTESSSTSTSSCPHHATLNLTCRYWHCLIHFKGIHFYPDSCKSWSCSRDPPCTGRLSCKKSPGRSWSYWHWLTTGNLGAEHTTKGKDPWQTGLPAKLFVNSCRKEGLLEFYSQDFNGAPIPGSQPALIEKAKQIDQR